MDTPLLMFGEQPEHVLVTGATGFIGKALVRALLAQGHRVTVLTRRPQAAVALFGSTVACVEAASAITATQPIDVVVNLAGARILGWRWTAARQAVLRQSRIGLTQKLLTELAQRKHQPRLWLNASAIGYYGIQDQADTAALDESSPPQPIFMSRLCQEWEASAAKGTALGIAVKCFRLGLVLGRQGALPLMLLPIRLGLGGALGSGRQSFSWIHINDVLAGIAHLWRTGHTSPEVQVYNFTAPEVVTQRQFSQTAAALLHRPCFLPTPAWPMRLMLGEQADLLLEGQRVAPVRLQQEGFVFKYPDLRSALQNLL